jgi:hypothetical protein
MYNNQDEGARRSTELAGGGPSFSHRVALGLSREQVSCHVDTGAPVLEKPVKTVTCGAR